MQWVAAGILLACVPEGAAETAPGAVEERPVRILFIGNSYTFYHDLPGLVTAFLEARGRKAEAGRYLVGGASLRDHWYHNEGLPAPKPAVPPAPGRKGGLDRLLREEGPWNYVVLQGQSQEALDIQPCEFDTYAAKLVAKVRAAQPDAVPVFYLTWARQHIPDQQAEITRTYAAAAKANRALLVPAGEAWRSARIAREGLVLHEKDRSHLNPAGTYLTACVFYAVLSGASPVGLPAKIEKAGGGKKPVCDVPDETARFLQETAWRTVQQQKP